MSRKRIDKREWRTTTIQPTRTSAARRAGMLISKLGRNAVRYYYDKRLGYLVQVTTAALKNLRQEAGQAAKESPGRVPEGTEAHHTDQEKE